MTDLIDRQAAIDAHYEYCNKHPDASFPVWSLKILEDLPSAQPEQTNSWYINSWCIDCKEYDKEKHYCPRFNRVIKQTLDDAYRHGETDAEARFHAQQRWIPCSERLPEPRVAVLGYAPKFKNIFALYYDSVMGWMVWSPIRDDCLPNSQGDIIAWMPLPEPYWGEGD